MTGLSQFRKMIDKLSILAHSKGAAALSIECLMAQYTNPKLSRLILQASIKLRLIKFFSFSFEFHNMFV